MQLFFFEVNIIENVGCGWVCLIYSLRLSRQNVIYFPFFIFSVFFDKRCGVFGQETPDLSHTIQAATSGEMEKNKLMYHFICVN